MRRKSVRGVTRRSKGNGMECFGASSGRSAVSAAGVYVSTRQRILCKGAQPPRLRIRLRLNPSAKKPTRAISAACGHEALSCLPSVLVPNMPRSARASIMAIMTTCGPSGPPLNMSRRHGQVSHNRSISNRRVSQSETWPITTEAAPGSAGRDQSDASPRFHYWNPLGAQSTRYSASRP